MSNKLCPNCFTDYCTGVFVDWTGNLVFSVEQNWMVLQEKKEKVGLQILHSVKGQHCQNSLQLVNLTNKHVYVHRSRTQQQKLCADLLHLSKQIQFNALKMSWFCSENVSVNAGVTWRSTKMTLKTQKMFC